jgi:hypothetical protein
LRRLLPHPPALRLPGPFPGRLASRRAIAAGARLPGPDADFRLRRSVELPCGPRARELDHPGRGPGRIRGGAGGRHVGGAALFPGAVDPIEPLPLRDLPADRAHRGHRPVDRDLVRAGLREHRAGFIRAQRLPHPVQRRGGDDPGGPAVAGAVLAAQREPRTGSAPPAPAAFRPLPGGRCQGGLGTHGHRGHRGRILRRLRDPPPRSGVPDPPVRRPAANGIALRERGRFHVLGLFMFLVTGLAAKWTLSRLDEPGSA